MTQHTDLIERLSKGQTHDPASGELRDMSSVMDDAADALKAQAREIAELKAQESELCTLYGLAQAECQKLRKDVERYRHLRDCNSGSLAVMQITGTGEDDWCILTEDAADAAIDAAMKGQP